MFPVSAAFLTALSTSHTIKFKADILQGGLTTLTLSGRVISGSVADDKSADRRRRLENLVIVDPITLTSLDTGPASLVPQASQDFITTYGNEIRPYYGVVLASGVVEYVPMGTFRMTKVNIKDGANGVTITVSGDDRSVNVTRNAFLTVFPVTDDNGANVATLKSRVVRKIILNRHPQAQLSQSDAVWDAQSPALTPTAPQLFANRGSDPWAFARQITTAIGCEVYLDRLGLYVFLVDPALAAGVGKPIYSLTEGATCSFDDADRDVDDTSGGCNVFLVTGVGSGVTSQFPPTGLYWDNDPSSATYVAPWSEGDPSAFGTTVTMWNVLNGTAILKPPNSSTYGLVVQTFTDPVVTSISEAIASSKKRLALNLGPTETITLSGWAIPHLDTDDVISAKRTKIGASGGNYVITSVRTPFTPGDKQTITARKQRAFT